MNKILSSELRIPIREKNLNTSPIQNPEFDTEEERSKIDVPKNCVDVFDDILDIKRKTISPSFHPRKT